MKNNLKGVLITGLFIMFYMSTGCTNIVPISELEYEPLMSSPDLVKNKSTNIMIREIQDARDVSKEEKGKAYIGKEVADTGWTAEKYFLEVNVEELLRIVLTKELARGGLHPIESATEDSPLFLDCKINDFWVRAGWFTKKLGAKVSIEMKLSDHENNELILIKGNGHRDAFFRGGDIAKDMMEALNNSFKKAVQQCLTKIYVFIGKNSKHE